ncbi:MAG: hydroxymethylbilane synthase [Vampirovibrionales bacterium]
MASRALPPDTLVLGTRDSALALWQAHTVLAWLQTQLAPHQNVLLKTTKTLGDLILDRPFHAFDPLTMQRAGGATGGVFVKELEHYLLSDVPETRITLAVHSMKDVPSRPAPATFVIPFGAREDVRDVWVFPKTTALERFSEGHTLAQLPSGTRVGSSGLRRVAQVLAQRSDVTCVPIRGNVQTRLNKLDAGEADVLLLAMAGLKRLGLYPSHERLMIPACPEAELVPAPAQGMLALQGNVEDAAWVLPLCASSCEPQTFTQVWIERTMLEKIEGGCQTPLGVHATPIPCGVEAPEAYQPWRVRVFYAPPLREGETMLCYTHQKVTWQSFELKLPRLSETLSLSAWLETLAPYRETAFESILQRVLHVSS